MAIGTPAQQQLGKKFFEPFFTWADDTKLREWLREQDPDELEQFLNWFDFANHRDRETLGRQELRNLRTAAVNSTKRAVDDQIPDEALTDIRKTLESIKAQLPTLTASNAVKADIHADVSQIEVEVERPAPRRRFMVLYLESLRDNLAKAAGVGTVALLAAVGGILAKYFGVL
jgi:hypothetical protein